MEEHSLNPGDKVGQWTIDRHIANGCIYAVTREGDNQEYALKLRESHNRTHYNDEIELLKRVNPNGDHPAFQKLIDYDPGSLYMILSPLMPPGREFRKIPPQIIATLDVDIFVPDFLHAVKHAAMHGRAVAKGYHFFITPDGRPFFLGLIEEPACSGTESLNWSFIEWVMMRLVNETGFVSREKMTDPVFNPMILVPPGGVPRHKRTNS